MKRRFVCMAMVAGLLASIVCAEDRIVQGGDSGKAEAASFSFAFITDAHLAPNLGSVREWELHAPRETLVDTPLVGYEKVLEEIKGRGVDFVITGGDDVELHTYERPPINGYLPVTEDFDALDQCVKRMTKIETATGLPFYHTTGNHQSFEYPPATPDHPLYAQGWFIKYWGVDGKAYSSFDTNGWHFIILSTHDKKDGSSREWAGISDEQGRWLEKDLEKTGKETPIVLIAHVPYDRPRIRGDWDKVAQVLKGYNVKLGLCGHEHCFREFEWNGIPCVVGPALSGGVWSAVRSVNGSTYCNGEHQGYLILDVSGGEISWRYYPFTYNIERYYFEQTGKRPYGRSDYWYLKNKNK